MVALSQAESSAGAGSATRQAAVLAVVPDERPVRLWASGGFAAPSADSLAAAPDDLAQAAGRADDSFLLYMHEMARVALLSAAEEISLGTAVQAGLLAASRLEESAERSPDELRALWDVVWQGDAARKRLIESNLRLVTSIARRYGGRGLSLQDLVQEGNIGLIQAVDRFDPTLGYRFSTYGSCWIRQAIQRGLANHARIIRIPCNLADEVRRVEQAHRRLVQYLGREPEWGELAAEVGLVAERTRELMNLAPRVVSLDCPVDDDGDKKLSDIVEDKRVVQPGEVAALGVLKDVIRDLLGRLKPRESLVLQMRFGLHDDREHTLEELSALLRVSRERVRQIELTALRKLRTAKWAASLKEYAEAN